MSEHILFYKMLYSALVAAVYMIGRRIPLYGVELQAYQSTGDTAGNILLETIGSGVYRYSLFALGLTAYMIAGMVKQAFLTIHRADRRFSMKKANIGMVLTAFFIAVCQAIYHLNDLQMADESVLAKGIAGMEMVTAVLLILWLGERNRRYGVGGQSLFILLNVLDSLARQLGGAFHAWLLPALILIPVTVFFEYTEKRIPVQRISIHNIYADKNYLAFKLVPVGVMPVMFASSLFTLVQMLGSAADDWTETEYWETALSLSHPCGIAVYLGIVAVLTVGFAFLMLDPAQIARQLRESGDSLVGIRAGADTRRYLMRTVFHISLFGALVLCLCTGIPLVYAGQDVSMLPTTFMLLTSLWCNLFQELRALQSYDRYGRVFIKESL